MFKETKKHVFYIEGGDNVGKTTLIETLKRSGNIDRLKYNRIQFSKYPTAKATNNINDCNQILKNLNLEYKDKELDHQYYIRKADIVKYLIKFLISDMLDSFTNIDKDQYMIKYPDDILNICDRGFLSTYLYQYRGMLKTALSITNSRELDKLKQFMCEYVPYSDNDLNIVILNNNSNPLSANIIIDKSETIEYKRQFDYDVELQAKVNSSLMGIVSLIEQDRLKNLSGVKFYKIDIFKEDGETRKTPSELCDELISIINKEE